MTCSSRGELPGVYKPRGGELPHDVGAGWCGTGAVRHGGLRARMMFGVGKEAGMKTV